MIVMNKPQNSATSANISGKTVSNPGNGIGDAGKTPDTAVARGDQCATPMPDNPDTVARGGGTTIFTVPEADRERLSPAAPWRVETVNLPSGPRSLPSWCRGGHINWRWPYSNSPDYMVRCATDPLAFSTSGAPVWRMFDWHDGSKKGRGWIAEREGVAACHYHDGAISLTEFEERVRWIEKPSQANGWKGEAETRKYKMLATAQQDGYAGRHFDITLAAQVIPIYSRETGTVMTKVEHGTKLRLRGPWHGGAPSGYTETSYWIDDRSARYGSWVERRKWYDRGGYFGLYIKPAILLDIMATYEPHVPWAMVTESWKGRDEQRLRPLVPETGLPKEWKVNPDQCPGHDYVLSPYSTGPNRTRPNDKCKFCGRMRDPEWVYVSSFTGKPLETPRSKTPVYFDRFLKPREQAIPNTDPRATRAMKED